MGRLKTGTPARVKLSSLDLSVMEEQPGEEPTPFMSLRGETEKAPKTTFLLHNKNKQRNTQNNRQKHTPISNVFWQHCWYRAKILPVHRG